MTRNSNSTKWHSNLETLEEETVTTPTPEQSYAKQQLRVNEGETKLLGVPWDKRNDTLQVTFPTSPAQCTKRGVLGRLAQVYDPTWPGITHHFGR